ncbi:E3 SUMO-protein ligase NSE2-like [Dreissena polymorpha]|uniref:E3 SUMO-protein ligase NSE2 n=1 Tax=Dreissena polymorpha TaxID=45954 RepID=A0A9D4JQH4_DREPO|nr:E3 SUMO-protein ligase NSE2-like [Dreissena polymorpha]KAH3820805.1 hypothetical protein DPMN_122554 [Dreissena polymorpha]
MSHSFALVDDAVRSVNTMDDYFNVGMDICTDIGLEFMENAKPEDDTSSCIHKFKDVMIKLVNMNNEVQALKTAVEEVKARDPENNETLAEVLEARLAVLKSNFPDAQYHEKVKEFQEKMSKAMKQESSSKTGQGEMEIEVSQETLTFKCPYTGKVMECPMRNKHCGHSYERDGILQYIKQRQKKAKCPVVGCANEKPIVQEDLVENRELKRYIERKIKSQ